MREFQTKNRDLEGTMKTHLINDLSSFGIWSDNYETFLQRRAEIISAELKTRIIERRSDSLGQMIRANDLEELESLA